MNKIIDMEANLEHKVSEVICIQCGYRWIATRPSQTLLKQLECPNCEKQVEKLVKENHDLREKLVMFIPRRRVNRVYKMLYKILQKDINPIELEKELKQVLEEKNE